MYRLWEILPVVLDAARRAYRRMCLPRAQTVSVKFRFAACCSTMLEDVQELRA